MEGVLAILFIFGGGTVFLLSVSPVGRAIAERIRRSGPVEVEAEVYHELDALRADVNDLQERVDFAERLLADKRGDARLPDGAVSPGRLEGG